MALHSSRLDTGHNIPSPRIAGTQTGQNCLGGDRSQLVAHLCSFPAFGPCYHPRRALRPGQRRRLRRQRPGPEDHQETSKRQSSRPFIRRIRHVNPFSFFQRKNPVLLPQRLGNALPPFACLSESDLAFVALVSIVLLSDPCQNILGG